MREELPSPPKKLKQMIGPSLILLGLGLGSGEIILWPYLASNYGLGMIWAIVIGVTMQFFINMEVERYAIIYGESIFVGFAKWTRILPAWFIFSTFLGFGWPGIGLSGATLFSNASKVADTKTWGIVVFLLIGVVLSIGKQLYVTVESLQKILISIGTPAILLLTLFLAKPETGIEIAKGLVGIGNGYRFLPKDVVMATFLGAMAFAGAGGNLNLAQSFYVRDKGYGMGKYAEKIKSLFTSGGADKNIKLEGKSFEINNDNLTRFKQWWRMVNLEHFLVFWLLGTITMVTLSVLAFTTTFGHPENPEGIKFVITEANYISLKLIPLAGTIFLTVAGLMLAATQLTVLDSTSRIITENFLLGLKKTSAHVARIYYVVLWLQIMFGIGIILFSVAQPKDLLVISACINAFTMFIYTALILYLNNFKLAKQLRPSWWRNLILIMTFCFYGIFGFLTLTQ